MAERKYKSKYGADGDITDAQYLTEIIIERIAKKDKKSLGWKFWNDPVWAKVFRLQITHANKLLKEFTCLEIANALRHKKGLWITSLGAKKQIAQIIEEELTIVQTKQTYDDYDKDNDIFNIDDVDIVEVEIEHKKQSIWGKLNGKE